MEFYLQDLVAVEINKKLVFGTYHEHPKPGDNQCTVRFEESSYTTNKTDKFNINDIQLVSRGCFWYYQHAFDHLEIPVDRYGLEFLSAHIAMNQIIQFIPYGQLKNVQKKIVDREIDYYDLSKQLNQPLYINAYKFFREHIKDERLVKHLDLFIEKFREQVMIQQLDI